MAVYFKNPKFYESWADRVSREAREARFAKMSPVERRAAQLDARERGVPVAMPAAPAPAAHPPVAAPAPAPGLSALERRAAQLAQQDAAKRGGR
ncbi:MAG: hypothetical protein U1E30_12750 [Rhodoblastus sp.]